MDGELEKMLKEKCFSFRIKNKIKEILEEPEKILESSEVRTTRHF